MDKLTSTQHFVAVVEQGSFARAADRLNVSVSVVSRNVSDLEAQLGTRLLNRTTRRLSLTETGRAYYERANVLLADWDEMESEASSSVTEPRGTVRLTASITLGVNQLAPAIAAFQAAYPAVRFDCNLTDRYVDLIEEGMDLAIRIGSGSPGHLVARRIGETQMIASASPGYLKAHGKPKVPSDLLRHNCITYEYITPRDHWRFVDNNKEIKLDVKGSAHSNLGNMAAALAEAGVGICYEPDFIVADAIKRGALVPLLRNYWPPASPVMAVYPSRRHLSAKVRQFVDFLAARWTEVNASR